MSSKKHFTSSAGGFVFLGIQPLLAASIHFPSRCWRYHAFSDHANVRWSCSVRRQAARWHHGQPWFYLRLATGRGTMPWLGCPREHMVAHETCFVYPVQDTYPRTCARSLLTFERQGYFSDPASWSSALTLLVTSDVPPRTSLPSSTGSAQSLPFFAPASAVPWPAPCPGQLWFHKTRGTDPPSRSRLSPPS